MPVDQRAMTDAIQRHRPANATALVDLVQLFERAKNDPHSLRVLEDRVATLATSNTRIVVAFAYYAVCAKANEIPK